MTYHVTVSSEAHEDARAILGWISKRSTSGAASWHRRWVEIREYLEDHAAGCGLALEDNMHDVDIRQVIFRTRKGRPYRALFTIYENKVFVLRVRGPGQDLVPPDQMPTGESD